jgi:tRNA(Ile)-lysidine synthase
VGERLHSYPKHPHIWVAYSGGCDSTVLLYLLHHYSQHHPLKVSAIYIDHQLDDNSSQWGEHCRSICHKLSIPLVIRKVDIDGGDQGIEAAAREARYKIFESLLGPHDLLLMAHHQNDQVETLLLRLMRGSGVHGAAAIPELRALGEGWLARPLLAFTREQIMDYAHQQRLKWIEDPSNQDHRYERNFVRHQLLPLLQSRREGIHEVLARTTQHFDEAAKLLDQLAEEDLNRIGGEGAAIDCAALIEMESGRCRNLVRYWIGKQGFQRPDTVHLNRIIDEVIGSRVDRTPLVQWKGGEIRRHKGHLYCLPLSVQSSENLVMKWQGEPELLLPHGLGILKFKQVRGAGIVFADLPVPENITISWRRGGEKIKLVGKAHRQSLKKLFQQASIPSWDRQRIPLIYCGAELLQVVGLWISAAATCRKDEVGVVVEWIK